MEDLPGLSIKRQKSIGKLTQKKYRNSENVFLCEGFRLLDSALTSPAATIREIVISRSLRKNKREADLVSEARRRHIPVFTAAEKIIQALSDEISPSGLVFTVEKSVMSREVLTTADEQLILYLDRITDPGNMGTIIRSAAWFGIPFIVLSPGCVDPFNPKAVRASAGAVFTLPICPGIEFDWLHEWFKKKDYEFIATVAQNGLPPDQWHLNSKSIIFFGQEAGGLDKQILDLADRQLTIPGAGKVESLNISVAAGIFLFELFQRTR